MNGDQPLRIVVVCAESMPWVVRTRIGQVTHYIARTLPKVAGDRPVEVRTVIPRYGDDEAGMARVDYEGFQDYGTLVVSSGAWGVVEVPVSARKTAADHEVYAIDYGGVFDTAWARDLELGRPADVYEYVPELGRTPTDAQRKSGLRMLAGFGFFSSAVVRLIQYWADDGGQRGEEWRAELLHLHDWPTAMVAALIEPEHSPLGWWQLWERLGTRVWWTHHPSPNPGEKGCWSERTTGLTPDQLGEMLGLLPRATQARPILSVLSHGDREMLSVLETGMKYAHRGERGIGGNTGSPTYRDELCTPALGGRAAQCFEEARDDHRFVGILNGIDLNDVDPSRERNGLPPLEAHFDPVTFRVPHGEARRVIEQKHKRGKFEEHLRREIEACRNRIQDRAMPDGDEFLELLDVADRRLGSEFAVCGDDHLMVAPHAVVAQKGLDLFADVSVADDLCRAYEDLRVIIAGAPNSRGSTVSAAVEGLANRLPSRVLYVPWLTRHLERVLLHYGDSLVMPSRTEPCSLTQMVAIRYYTVPVAHRTGALADSIDDVSGCGRTLSPKGANGFLFGTGASYTAPDFNGKAQAAMRARAGDMLDCYGRYMANPGRPDAAWPRIVGNAFTKASSEFSWEVRTSDYLNRW